MIWGFDGRIRDSRCQDKEVAMFRLRDHEVRIRGSQW